MGVRVENDFLIRVRHYSRKNGSRISMFRALVHTSFVQDNVIRLQAKELDGTSAHEYPADFFVDMIFTDARNQSNIIMSGAHHIDAPEASVADMEHKKQ